MKSIQNILSLMRQALPTGLLPAATVPPATQPVSSQPMFQAAEVPAAKAKTDGGETGLRPVGLTAYQRSMLATSARPFPFYLEASWVDAQTFTVEVLCWEFFSGKLEPLTAFVGDPDRKVGLQVQPVQIDHRGYYSLMQISHNSVNGTWWRQGAIPRSGHRRSIQFGPWTRAWQDAKPDGLETVQGLAETLALSTMQFVHRKETDAQWAARRMRITQQTLQELRRQEADDRKRKLQQQRSHVRQPDRFATRGWQPMNARRYQPA